MRVYVLSNASVKKNMYAKLEPYFHEQRKVSYIWSVNGLFQIENQKIYKMQIKDVPVKKTLLGAFPITIDESEIKRDEEELSQIAPRSRREYITIKSYRLPSCNNIEWILEYKDDELQDNYFTLGDINEPTVKAALQQFLNL